MHRIENRGPRLSLVAAAAGLVAAGMGCGNPYDDLLGVWQVTAHTENETGCEAEGPAVAEPPYIKFVEGSFFGQEYAEYLACTDAGTACDEPGGLFGLLYAEEISGGMRAQIYASSGSPEDCILSGTVSDAVVEGGQLRIETRSRTLDNVTDSSCDPDDTQARWDELPCTRYEVIVGARI